MARWWRSHLKGYSLLDLVRHRSAGTVTERTRAAVCAQGGGTAGEGDKGARHAAGRRQQGEEAAAAVWGGAHGLLCRRRSGLSWPGDGGRPAALDRALVTVLSRGRRRSPSRCADLQEGMRGWLGLWWCCRHAGGGRSANVGAGCGKEQGGDAAGS